MVKRAHEHSSSGRNSMQPLKWSESCIPVKWEPQSPPGSSVRRRSCGPVKVGARPRERAGGRGGPQRCWRPGRIERQRGRPDRRLPAQCCCAGRSVGGLPGLRWHLRRRERDLANHRPNYRQVSDDGRRHVRRRRHHRRSGCTAVVPQRRASRRPGCLLRIPRRTGHS